MQDSKSSTAPVFGVEPTKPQSLCRGELVDIVALKTID